MPYSAILQNRLFLSTPSARRATLPQLRWAVNNTISIHALREEGDRSRLGFCCLQLISIHALREEGDACIGRRDQVTHQFLSTPSARRATWSKRRKQWDLPYFYPRPPRGGRPMPTCPLSNFTNFYPRPPRGGRRPVHALLHAFPVYFYPRPPRGGRQVLA